MDDEVWVPTVFTKNRDRLLQGDIARKFFALVLEQARVANLLSDEHFSVHGTLIEAWASHKSFQLQRKDVSGSSSWMSPRRSVFCDSEKAVLGPIPPDTQMNPRPDSLLEQMNVKRENLVGSCFSASC